MKLQQNVKRTTLVREYIVTEPTVIDGVYSKKFCVCPNCGNKRVKIEHTRCKQCWCRLVFLTEIDIED